MAKELRVGDRVRITAHVRQAGHSPGEKGTVRRVPDAAVGPLGSYYLVAIDAAPAGIPSVFTADEIEPDA